MFNLSVGKHSQVDDDQQEDGTQCIKTLVFSCRIISSVEELAVLSKRDVFLQLCSLMQV